MAAGSVVAELGNWFDLYWNSSEAYPVKDIARASGRPNFTDEELRARFDSATSRDERPAAPMAPDFFGESAFSIQLEKRRVHLIPAQCSSFADSPNKIDPANYSLAVDDTLTHRFLQLLSDTHSEALLFSPYFVPGKEAMNRIADLRAAGVTVRVVTNSLAVSDEPLVSVGLEHHEVELLKMGVELYELSSERLKMDRTLKGLLGTSTGRLHAKLAFLDRETVLVGSMNLDPRSTSINTEVGVRVVSPELAQMVIAAFKVDQLAGVYQVKLRDNGRGVSWVAVDGDSTEELDIDPDTSFLQRLRLMMLSMFVPESQL
jgi:cardiolipin synthase C